MILPGPPPPFPLKSTPTPRAAAPVTNPGFPLSPPREARFAQTVEGAFKGGSARKAQQGTGKLPLVVDLGCH